MVLSLPAASSAWRTTSRAARILGVQLLLIIGQELHAFVQDGRGVFGLLVTGSVAGVEVLLEVDLAAGRDRKAFDEFLDVAGVDLHGRESSWCVSVGAASRLSTGADPRSADVVGLF